MSTIDALALTRDLLRFDTVNPPGQEAQCIAHLGRLLGEHGLRTAAVECAPGRPSLVARLDGSDASAPAIGFTGHVDTVPLGEAAWRREPFAGEVDGDRLFGRGASDMKSGVAAMVAAVCAVARHGRPRRGIELVLTADEERGCYGARAIVAQGGLLGSVGALVIGEPTGLRPCLGHRGVTWVEASFTGRTAHASAPELGDNAVLKGCRAALRAAAYDFEGVRHEHLGPPSLNVGRLAGGQNLNSVPDQAALGIDLRTIPGQTAAGLCRHLSGVLGEGAELAVIVETPGIWTDPGGAWITGVIERTRGYGEPGPIAFCTDGSILAPAYGDVPTVILGPGEFDQAHRTDEWCSMAKVEAATALYGELMESWAA
ncbi:MAG: M20 family metallopeptidase [Geminicoccaceae bacterium]